MSFPDAILKFGYADFIMYDHGISDARHPGWRYPSRLCYTCVTGWYDPPMAFSFM